MLTEQLFQTAVETKDNSNAHFVLVTEAEWEYVCSAGSTTESCT